MAPKCWATYSGSMRIVRKPPPVIFWKTSEGGKQMSQAVELDRNPGTREVEFRLDGKTVSATITERR
ncbi:MAG: hypothetical protein FJ225_13235 [Lentisphaerae bacterium]|nr:hypothetical protein [Lentisphaerota bacterium]